MNLFELVEEVEIKDPSERDTFCVGLGAEYLVAADLSFAGHRCFLAGAGLPYDLVVEVGSHLIKVQVKATRSIRSYVSSKGKGKSSRIRERYVFGRSTSSTTGYLGKADVFAFVAVDVRKVLYSKVHNSSSEFRVRPGLMTDDYCRISMEQALGIRPVRDRHEVGA